MSEQVLEKASESFNTKIYTRVYGIWKITRLKESFSFKAFKGDSYASAIPSVRRFLLEIYSLDPTLVLLFLFITVWKGIEPGITVYIAGQLLTTVRQYLNDHPLANLPL